MTYQCNYCRKSYPTNVSLYNHKKVTHPKPKLVLVNHSHKSKPFASGTKRRPTDDGISSNVEGCVIDDSSPPISKNKNPKVNPRDFELPPDLQQGDGLQIIDNYDNNRQSDDDLTIVDQYDRNKLDDRKQYHSQSDDELDIADQYDSDKSDVEKQDESQSDKELTIIDQGNLDYKKLYEKCVEAHRVMKIAYKRIINDLKQKHDDTRRKLEEECDAKINSKVRESKPSLQKYSDEMKDTYEERVNMLKKQHNDVLKNLESQKKIEMDEYEKQCAEQIKFLRDKIQAMEDDDDDDVSSLSKAIFNRTTMEEIFKIQQLVKNHRIDEVVKNHLPTLQNLFLSLSYGVLPLCQPQREQVTDDQRLVVEKLQTASRQSAKTLLQGKQSEVINLFTIIKDSIKLARNAYNKYATNT